MSFRSALLLLVLLAHTVLAQAPADGAFLPEGLPAAPGAAQAGIEATGDTTEVRALTVWADQHLFSDPEQAERITQRALVLARNLDDRQGIGKSLLILGNLAPNLNQKEAYFTDAQEAFEQIGDEHGVLRSRLNMGTVYQRRGAFEQALTTYFDILKGFERLGDTERQAITLNNIGNIHREQDNLEAGLAYYERAVVLAETLDKPEPLVYMLNNLGTALADQGAYEKAEATFRRALAVAEEHEEVRYYTGGLSANLGILFIKQGQLERALPFLFMAERLAEERSEEALLFEVYNELGKAYMGLNQYDEALRYAQQGLALARNGELATRRIFSISRQMTAHQTLSQIYKAAGNPEQALAHYEEYMASRDSVFNAEKTKIVSELQTRYETEKKQRAIERFEQENKIQALQLTLLLSGIILALLVAGLFYYRYRTKRKANRLLEDLNTAKSRFFANISHEFRTPLTVILGGAKDMLSGRFGKMSEKASAQLQAMQRNSRQLQRLIDEVLDLNRLEVGKLELNPAPGDLVRSLRRIVEADASLAERNGINLTFEPNVEHCPRLYDRAKLEKIVGNLLSNALKFTSKDGSVRVSLTCGQETEIIVSDDGPGIPAETQAKVFERFVQLEDGFLHGGAGIGLALAKELAELHGGTIGLESETGEGSTFTVRLPLEAVPLEAVLEGDGAGVSGSLPAEAIAMSGDGLPENPVVANDEENESDRTTVLVIEDNADVRAFVRRSLEKTYRVLEAADGEAGLQQARAALPDLIVSDVMLPGIDGYEVAKQLKAEGDTECIPVVMLTARAAEEDQTEGYGSGAEVYITKPFSPETLRAAVARLLEERLRLRRQLQENTKREEQETAKNEEPTFSDRARAVVLENLHDEDFGIEELAHALGMSRRTLYRRLKPEVGLFPSDFIRILRVERARELLANEAGSVSEVAYAVGFRSLARFTNCFREHYGEPPSSVLRIKEK